eukprot:4220764-Heterocapsa_arctica.AAC.1
MKPVSTRKRGLTTRSQLSKHIQSLGLSVRDTINIIKAATQSRATYGAAVDPFTVAHINTLRG